MDPFGLFAEFIEDLTKTNTIMNLGANDPVQLSSSLGDIQSPSAIVKSESLSSGASSARPMSRRMSTFQDQHHYPDMKPSTTHQTPGDFTPSLSNAQIWVDQLSHEPPGLDFTHTFIPQAQYQDVLQQESPLPFDLAYTASIQHSQHDHYHLPSWAAYHTYAHAAPDPNALSNTTYPQYSPSHQPQLIQPSHPLPPAVALPTEAPHSTLMCHCPYAQTHHPDAVHGTLMPAKQHWGFHEASHTHTDRHTGVCR